MRRGLPGTQSQKINSDPSGADHLRRRKVHTGIDTLHVDDLAAAAIERQLELPPARPPGQHRGDLAADVGIAEIVPAMLLQAILDLLARHAGAAIGARIGVGVAARRAVVVAVIVS